MRVLSSCLLFLFLSGCAQPEVPAGSLVGTWSLRAIDGKPPGSSNIEAWTATFAADGTWSYGGSMSGRYAGMSLKGDGTWRITGGKLVYRAGGNTGTSALTLHSTTLTLSPDPVITKPGGAAGVETEYARVK